MIVKYGDFLWDYFRVVAVDLFYGEGGNPKEFYTSLANGARSKLFTPEVTGNRPSFLLFRDLYFWLKSGDFKFNIKILKN